MVLKWIILAFVVSVGSALETCNVKKVDFAAPVFGAGDNLSVDRCGLWDQGENFRAPWFGNIWLLYGGGCRGVLISPTSFLTYLCKDYAKKFVETKRKNDWTLYLGKCLGTSNTNSDECMEKGEGQKIKLQNVTSLNAPGYPNSFEIWTFERVALKENKIWPVCLSNIGNLQDYNETKLYTAFDWEWNKYNQASAYLSQDFEPCLNESESFQTCNTVHENFLCAHLINPYWYKAYLSHQVNNTYFLRAISVEPIARTDHFYYDVFPLLNQIASATEEISLMPGNSEARNKTGDV